MTTMIFRNIYDVEGLFRLIDSCNGPVYLKSGHDDQVDLRGNAAIKGLLVDICNKNGLDKISVVINDKKDMPRIFNYLLSCKRHSVSKADTNNSFKFITDFSGKIAKLMRAASM